MRTAAIATMVAVVAALVVPSRAAASLHVLCYGDSITAGDMPMIQAGVLFIALVFVVVNLVTDIGVALLDPRTRKAA